MAFSYLLHKPTVGVLTVAAAATGFTVLTSGTADAHHSSRYAENVRVHCQNQKTLSAAVFGKQIWYPSGANNGWHDLRRHRGDLFRVYRAKQRDRAWIWGIGWKDDVWRWTNQYITVNCRTGYWVNGRP